MPYCTAALVHGGFYNARVTRILNLAAYKFVDLSQLSELRGRLLEHGRALGLKGTILLAEEGINLFLAGEADALDHYLRFLAGDPRLAELEVKKSWSDTQPFGKFLVRIKREIIRMNRPAIVPQAARAPALSPSIARRWLDQGHDDDGRPVVMLDTRNAFEVAHGTFDGAVHWDLARFSEFPDAFAAHRAELEGKTVISFCTGGIRCEKAALLMRADGHARTYQLDGGILNYFEKEGGAHYHGRCFVFDERESLDAGLRPCPVEPEGSVS